MSAFMWRALHAGEDKEHGFKVEHEGKKVQVNTAAYGFDLVMGLMLKAMEWDGGFTPHQAILVFEGMHSKRLRQAIDPSYKEGRESRPPQQYEEFQKLAGMLDATWRSVGAITMSQDSVEGDDVLGYLAKNTESALTIATYDNDLAVCNGKNEYGAEVDVWVDGVVGANKFGPFDHKLITLYKALVGKDKEIKGCPGFGLKSWEQLFDVYGEEGLNEIAARLEAGDLGDIHAQREEDKLIAKICDNEQQVIRCYRLAKIHPEWVNTRDRILKVKPGMVAQEAPDTDYFRFIEKGWAGRSYLVTRSNFTQLAVFCRAQFSLSPFVALDIETSTPDASDEWLANQVPPNPDGVDVLGSEITGLSLTFGANLQYTVYISVAHAETDNVTSEEVRRLVADIPSDKLETVIQNLSFELTVLYQEWSHAQEDNGYHGFLPNCLDTKLEASYVDENQKNGLKGRSLAHLGYQQQTFEQTTRLTGVKGTLRKGGRLINETTNEDGEVVETRQYKMRELPATHVFKYGCDDTICTAALHNFYRLMMELEHHWEVYKRVEIDAAYMSAAGFLQGTDFSPARMRELMAEDDATYDAAWATLRSFLMANGWAGTICPVLTAASKPADWKLSYEIVTGEELDCKARLPEKVAAAMEEKAPVLAALLAKAATSGQWDSFNSYVASHFKGEPVFNIDSPKQKEALLYEVMKLPVVWRNAPTDNMRAAGISQGSARSDNNAIDWAKKFSATPEQTAVLEALKLMQMVGTRRKLYYAKYMGFIHWKTGKLHSQVNQCEANTRRESESGPNKQQLAKHQKIEGQAPKFRECFVPHHKDAVIVSLDEASQELRIIADYSRDPNMVACYVGDNKKDIHSLTGLGIAKRRYKEHAWSYEIFEAARSDSKHQWHKLAKECRVLGKKVNFTTEYGAMEDKVAETLLETVEDSKAFMAAKEEMFPVAARWKEGVIDEVRRFGIVRTKEGAVRHLRDALNSNDRYEASKAERQAVNFKIQSSAAEQTKMAAGSAWKRGLIFKYDCVFVGKVHDELVWSVAIKDLLAFLEEAHAGMTQPYGGMTIPIESSISFGPNFGQQVEIGERPTVEAVVGGLATMSLDYAAEAANCERWAAEIGQLAAYQSERAALRAKREGKAA
jgi:DNA polymerase I-like protein with 3'-5' exonuclease and polymerase domains